VAEVVCSLVPPGAKLAVATPYAADLAGLGSRRPVWFDTAVRGADAAEHLERLRGAGVRYLVVPHHSYEWLESSALLERRLAERDTFVTRQRRACAIWELAPAPRPVAAPALEVASA